MKFVKLILPKLPLIKFEKAGNFTIDILSNNIKIASTQLAFPTENHSIFVGTKGINKRELKYKITITNKGESISDIHTFNDKWFSRVGIDKALAVNSHYSMDTFLSFLNKVTTVDHVFFIANIIYGKENYIALILASERNSVLENIHLVTILIPMKAKFNYFIIPTDFTEDLASEFIPGYFKYKNDFVLKKKIFKGGSKRKRSKERNKYAIWHISKSVKKSS